jgi:hypothetical protein
MFFVVILFVRRQCGLKNYHRQSAFSQESRPAHEIAASSGTSLDTDKKTRPAKTMAISINIGTNANSAGLTRRSAKWRRGSAALPCQCINVVLICHKFPSAVKTFKPLDNGKIQINLLADI